MKCERLKQHQVKLGEKLKQQVQSACVANELTDIRKWQNLSSNQIFWHYMHTQSHSVLTASFQGEPGLASCPLILHHLFLNCASFCNRPKLSMSFLTQSHQVFFLASSLSNSFNLPRHTMLDPVNIICSFNISKPWSQPTHISRSDNIIINSISIIPQRAG